MILHITSNNIISAWKDTVTKLIESQTRIESNQLYRDAILVLEVINIDGSSENAYDDSFPMTWEEINYINQHLVTGTDEDKVIHEWTKLYRKRLVSQDYNQIEQVIEYLRTKPQGKRAQASIWDQRLDLYGDIGPCLQTLWFQINDNKLDLHVHMRASDAYRKLLMNINEFAALQRFVADRLQVNYGKYYMFVDTCHINANDETAANQLIK